MDEASVKAVPSLALLITVAAGAVVVLAFLHWVDFGTTEIRGTDADAATGISDGWIVAGLGGAILLLTGGVLFGPRGAPFLLPAIAIAAIAVLLIAGFDIVTHWRASDMFTNNAGVIEEAEGDPTFVPYVISALAILIALSAATIRGLQIWQESRSPDQAVFDQEAGRSAE
jgi:hypothetical protein